MRFLAVGEKHLRRVLSVKSGFLSANADALRLAIASLTPLSDLYLKLSTTAKNLQSSQPEQQNLSKHSDGKSHHKQPLEYHPDEDAYIAKPNRQ